MISMLMLFFSLAAFGADSADELLKASDRSRGAAQALAGVTWEADLSVTESGEKSDATYQIKVKGDNAIAEALAPARRKGEITLFNDRNLWFVKPGLKKPVSVSPRQKLMGQAATGDIASTQYARDYEGTIVKEEKKNGEAAWKLELKAKAKNVTYDKINYWISKKQRLGVYAEFLTVSGQVFKTASFKYDNTMGIGGGSYPFVSVMEIQDAANKDNVTVIRYKSPKEGKFPDSIFNVNNLVR